MEAEEDVGQVLLDLRKSLAWLDLALATLDEGVLVIDGQSKVLFANDALAKMVNKPRILLLGSFAWDALPLSNENSTLSKKQFLDALKDNKERSLGRIYRLGKDSEKSRVELSVAHIANTKHTVLVVRDVTLLLRSQDQKMKIMQEKAARQSAELSEQRARVQYKVASILAESIDVDDAMLQILEIVCTSLDWSAGTFWSVEPKSNKLKCVNSWAANSDKKIGHFIDVTKKQRFDKNEGLPGKIWQRGMPVWLEDITQELTLPRRLAAKKLGLRGAFAVPLKTDKDFIGVMEFFSTRIEKPDPELLTSMTTIGIQIAQFMQRKKIEKALKQSEERLRFMAEAMPQKIFTAKPTGEVDYLNPQWMKYTGFDFDDIKGWGWLNVIHPDDSKENMRVWKHSLRTGEPFLFEHRFRKADGEYRWHISRAQALRDDSGKILMWVGSNTDIEYLKRNTELEGITAALQEQRAHLIELNSAKDEFISLASHQLRTPATGVKQFIGLLIEGYAGELSKAQKEFAMTAYESNERQINIINDLLNVAQVDAGKVTLNKEKTNLVSLIKNVLEEQAANFAQRQQSVAYIYAYPTMNISVDKERLRMAIENIIDNAGKYTPHKRNIEVRLKKNKNSISIIVKDEGVGIEEGDIDKIFHKFTRLDSPLSISVGGSGLGLYWCKKIIKLHGGSIDVKSTLDVGSTFTVKLPNK